MKKKIIKAIYIILVFVISLVVIERITNTASVDMTAEMGEATLPTVTLMLDGRQINTLRGYTREMEIPKMRDAVYPLDEGRKLSGICHGFGRSITSLRYEVRPLSGNSLIESSSVTGMTGRGSDKRFSIQLKDLIEDDQEYMLILIVESGGVTARYYCRVVQDGGGERFHAAEHVGFVTAFSQKTFMKEEGREITRYLEPSADSDNSGFQRVDIHSSYQMVTWGGMEIDDRSDPEVRLLDIHSQTASLTITYRISIRSHESGRSRLYQVEEAYRVRYSPERMYLLDYERQMEYLFDRDIRDITGNIIDLSVSDTDMEITESVEGSDFAFVNGGRAFLYSNNGNRLVKLFGFWDDDNDDERTRFQKHRIKILNVDESGDAVFTVAGYMSRGSHEGEVGIGVYSYHQGYNTVEEQAFIPFRQAPELVISNFERLSYLGANGRFYIIAGTDIYSIELGDLVARRIVSGMLGQVRQGDSGKRYQISASKKTIAWQDENRKKLHVMNLTRGTETVHDAGPGESVRLIGFMGEDLVYGIVRDDDIRETDGGMSVDAMYCVLISDNDGNILEKYSPEGYYVTDVTITDEQIKLKRVAPDEEKGIYRDAPDDQITSTFREPEGSNRVITAVTEYYGTIVEIAVKNSINTKELLVQTPKISLYEGSRDVTIEREETAPLYYVYDIAGNAGIYAEEAEAVHTAYYAPGVVCAEDGSYIWYRGNLMKSNQLMAITRTAESYGNTGMTEADSMQLCLELMLMQEEKEADVGEMLSSGMDPADILRKEMDGYRILELDGCPMDAMLYYVNREIPVLARGHDGEGILIIGFNELNTVLLEPETGFLGKVGRNDSAALFAESGEHFITYLPVN